MEYEPLNMSVDSTAKSDGAARLLVHMTLSSQPPPPTHPPKQFTTQGKKEVCVVEENWAMVSTNLEVSSRLRFYEHVARQVRRVRHQPEFTVTHLQNPAIRLNTSNAANPTITIG
jgi:hypothetical protein